MVQSFIQQHKLLLFRRSVVILGVLLTMGAIIFGLWLQASAATATLVPNGLISSNWTGAFTNIDEGTTTTADYINTSTADAERTAEFTLSDLSNVVSASSITLNVCAYYASTSQNGGQYDDLNFGLRIAGTLQALTTVTPAYKASATNCTIYTATYTGNYAQSDINSLQVYLNRTIQGKGKSSTLPDDIRVVNTYVDVTYTEPLPPAENQRAYRWFKNADSLGSQTGWLDPAWGSRRQLSINNTQVSESLQNFPVRVSLTPSNFDYSKSLSGGADLRFTDSNGTTLLDYEIEKWTPGGTSEIWVKVPEITASSNDSIYAYYNNNAATSAQNPAAVWSNGYVGVWHLKENPENPSPQFYDSTNGGRNAYNVGNMTAVDSVAGKIGNGLRTDGVDDYAAVDSVVEHNFNGSFNIQLYARLTSEPEVNLYPSLLGKGLSGTANGWVIYEFGTTNAVTFKRNNVDYLVEGGASLSTTLKNYSINYNKTSGSLNMYANGAPTNGYGGVTFPMNSSTDPLRLGWRDNPMNGQFDEMRLSSVSRSSQWVKADHMSMENAYLTYGAEEVYSPGAYGTTLTPLAAQDTAATLTSENLLLRLRLLFNITQDPLPAGFTSYKLQVSPKSGTCDTNFTGETFTDVSPTSGLIRYFDNSALTNNAAIGFTDDDPVYSGTVIRQTYRESNPFTTTAPAQNGENIMWDFALDARNAPAGAYCLRVINESGAMLNSYVQVPEIVVAPGVATQANYRWFANADSATPGSPLVAQDTPVTVPVSTPVRLRQRLAVDEGQIAQSSGSYKLQYAEKVGICDGSFTGENYINFAGGTQKITTKGAGTGQTFAENTGEIVWSSPQNIIADDGTNAEVTVYQQGSYDTGWLMSNSHAFSIPANATINGIELMADRGGGVNSATRAVKLIKAGTIAGNDLGTFQPWNNSSGSWGGPSELWGLSWTPADINDSDFGAAVKAQLSLEFEPDVRVYVDYMSIKVYYTVPQSAILSYHDNSSIATSSIAAAHAQDPVNGERAKVLQTYQETDPYANSTASIAAGSDGLWDFSLSALSAADGKTYCIRTVKSDGSLLNNYSQIPEITIGAASENGPILDQQLRGGQSVLGGVKNPYRW